MSFEGGSLGLLGWLRAGRVGRVGETVRLGLLVGIQREELGEGAGGRGTSWRGLMLLGAVERRGALEGGRRVVMFLFSDCIVGVLRFG